MNHLVGQRPAAGDDPDRTGPVDPAGHDSELRLPRGDEPGAVRADETDVQPLQLTHDRDHVERRHPLGHRHHQVDPGVRPLEDGIRRGCRRDVDHGSLRPGVLDRLAHRVEDRDAVEGLAALPRRDPGDDLRPVVPHGARVEGAVTPGDPLDHHPGVLVDQNAHVPTPFTSPAPRPSAPPRPSTRPASGPGRSSGSPGPPLRSFR